MSWTWKLALLLSYICLIATNAQYYEEDPYSCAPDKVTYEWEKHNYYEILNVDSSLDSKSIRKAYRQQAQLWHPDKVKANETLTIEEINARFSQIAHAYETLSSPEKRHSYDRFLTNCESKRGKQPPPWQDNTNTYNTGNSYQYQQQQYGYNSAPRSNSNPTSVRKETDMLIDPMTGAPIMRETIYEEYSREGVYKISIMDYLIQQMDAWGNSYYQPLYPYPRVVEEGPLHDFDREQPSSSYEYDEPPFSPPVSNTLEEGSVLRADQMLLSDNERYRAHVVNCQLVIEAIRTSSTMEKDPTIEPLPGIFEVIWQSDNEIPFFGMGQEDAECFLALEGGQLMVAGGSPEYHTGEILWYSTIPDTPVEDDTFLFTYKTYHAKLEDDGKLAVYLGAAVDINDDEPTCIYATGPLGCLRVISNLLHIVRTARDGINLTPLQSLFGLDEDPEADSWDEGDDMGAAVKRTFRGIDRLAKEKLGPFFNNLFDFGEDPDIEEETRAVRSLKIIKQALKDATRFTREKLGSFLHNLFENDEEPRASYDDEANYDGEDSRLLSLLFGTARKVNRARKGIEKSLEKKTLHWVHTSIVKWQRYRTGR